MSILQRRNREQSDVYSSFIPSHHSDFYQEIRKSALRALVYAVPSPITKRGLVDAAPRDSSRDLDRYGIIPLKNLRLSPFRAYDRVCRAPLIHLESPVGDRIKTLTRI